MFWENKLENWVNQIRHQSPLPLRLEFSNGLHFDFGTHSPTVTVRLPSVAAANYFLTPSLSNLGTAYVEGKIDVDGPVEQVIAIVYALAKNTLKLEGKFARISRSFNHSMKKDAQAISYHYDVSNDFYKLWLDRSLVYSCAYFENGDETLDDAQTKKIDHILRKIQLRPGDTLLDIGCGWGALAMRAAQKFDAQCVGITLSKNQYDYAQEQVRQHGLSRQVEIRLQDYRDVRGSFDRITSVGMFEHVGIKNLPGYFAKIRALLNEGGYAMNHGITSTDINNGEAAYGGGEFISKYVFPQGELPHISLVLKAAQESGLETMDVENLRRHYAKTCALWAENFEMKEDLIKRTVDEKKFRIWRIYLAGSSFAFAQDWVSVYQVLVTKSNRAATALPWSRKYMYQT